MCSVKVTKCELHKHIPKIRLIYLLRNKSYFMKQHAYETFKGKTFPSLPSLEILKALQFDKTA